MPGSFGTSHFDDGALVFTLSSAKGGIFAHNDATDPAPGSNGVLGSLSTSAERFNLGSRHQSGLGFDPNFGPFRLSSSRKGGASAARPDLYGKKPKKGVVAAVLTATGATGSHFALKGSAGSWGRASYKRPSNGSPAVLESARKPGLNLVAGTGKKPQNGLGVRQQTLSGLGQAHPRGIASQGRRATVFLQMTTCLMPLPLGKANLSAPATGIHI